MESAQLFEVEAVYLIEKDAGQLFEKQAAQLFEVEAVYLIEKETGHLFEK